MDYVKNMVLFRRRCSDPSPQLVSLSPLADCDTNSSSSLCIAEPSEPLIQKQNTGLTTWSKKVGQKWDKLRRNNSSELLAATSGRRRHWSPIRIENKKILRTNSIRTTLSEKSNSNEKLDKNRNVELISGDYKKLYETYKETIDKKTDLKNLKGKRRLKSLTANLGLNEQQFLDYLLLIKPNSQEELKSLIEELSQKEKKEPPRKMESLSENNSFNSKQSKKFKAVRNIFSRFSSKSDDESEEHYEKKKSISSSSLPSLSEFLSNSKKAISLTEISNLLTSKSKVIKCDESGYGSDSTTMNSPRQSLKSQMSNVSGDDCSSITSSAHIPSLNSESTPKTSQNYYNVNTVDRKNKNGSSFKKEYRSKFRLSMHLKRPRSESADGIQSHSKRFNESKSAFLTVNKQSPTKMSVEDLNRSFDKILNSFDEDEALPLSNLSNKYPRTNSEASNGALQSRTAFGSTKMYLPTTSRIEQVFKCVRLKVQPHDFIGIKIGTKNDSGRYIITDIVRGSVAEETESFQIGDEIIKVNGTRLRGMPFTFATCSLTPVNDELEIVISREVLINNNENSNHTSILYTPFSASSSNKLKPKSTESKEAQKFDSYNNTASTWNRFSKYPENVNSAPNVPLTGMRKFSYVHDAQEIKVQSNKPRDSFLERPSPTTLLVKFKKGPGMKSMGFSIVGGRDTPRKPMNLFVKTIFLEGQAAENGILKKGDKLLSINGKSFDGLTHKEAIALFKNIKLGDVNLLVERLNKKNM